MLDFLAGYRKGNTAASARESGALLVGEASLGSPLPPTMGHETLRLIKASGRKAPDPTSTL